MKNQSVLKTILRWFSQKSTFIIILLLVIIAVLLFIFIYPNYSPNNENFLFGITTVTIFLAALTAIATLLQAVEIQKQREKLDRPYVIGFFDSKNNGALYFVIKNLGNSPAQNIKLRFDPPPIDYSNRSLNDLSLFSKPISFLPPEKEIRQFINVSHRFFEIGNQTKFNVYIEYASIFGDYIKEDSYFDLDYLKQATLPGKTIEDYLKSIAEELKKISQNLYKS